MNNRCRSYLLILKSKQYLFHNHLELNYEKLYKITNIRARVAPWSVFSLIDKVL